LLKKVIAKFLRLGGYLFCVYKIIWNKTQDIIVEISPQKRRASRLPLLAIMKRKSLYEKEIVLSLWLYNTR